MAYANSADPEQTASEAAVLLGFILFAIPLDTTVIFTRYTLIYPLITNE